MELRTYISPLLKWWWLIVLATGLAGVSSLLAVRQQQPSYQSRSTLMIGRTIDDPNPTGNQFYLSQQLAQTYVDIARREPVKNATKETLGLDWLPPYAVNVIPNTQLIEILVVDTNPERSYVVATELANQLIRLSPSGVQQEEQERQDFIDQQLNDLQTQIEETKTEIETQQEALGELFSARQIADVQTQIAGLESKRNTLQANYAALLANTQQGAINALTIIENASIPTVPISSNKTTTILTSAAIGFVLAVSAAYFLEYLDDSVKSVDDVKKAGDISTLASIPNVKLEQGANRLITSAQPRSPVSEIYRILRTNIQFSSVDNPPRKLLVTSANPGEGKTTIAANLAVVIAQAGHKVLLLDADLRRPMQHVVFDLNPKPGLTELLLENNLVDDSDDTVVPVEKFIQKTNTPNLHLMASGVIPHNPSELLGSFRMKAALDLLSSQYDFLIVDSPPILALADSLILSAQIDGVILVAQANRTKRRQLKLTVEKLQEVDAPLVGVTLNRGSQKEEGYSYYYYQSNKDQEVTIPSKRDIFKFNGKRVNGILPQRGRNVEIGSEDTI
jgi:non-specific protein-tyrosine kinase